MTIHYTLVFVLLVLEMSVFTILLLPMPTGVRRALTRFISTSPIVANAQYVLKIMFVFVLILFLDSLNRAFKSDHHTDHDHLTTNPQADTHLHMKIFRAQRNMYLTGFTVFLSLLLNRFITMVTQMSKIEEQLETLKKQASNNSKQHLKLIDEQDERDKKMKEMEKKVEEAEAKAKKADAVLAQAKGQNDEYMRLADKYNELERKLEGHGDAKKDK